MSRLALVVLGLGIAACRETVRIDRPPPDTDPTFRWSFVLERVVTGDGNVDYDRLWEHRDGLDEYLAWVAEAPTGGPEDARASQWINAHNAIVLHGLLHSGFRDSGVEPDVSTRRQYDLDKDWVTTGQIRHAYLRGYTQDPRIVGALIDGTKAGPPLRPFTYTDFDLNDELDGQMRRWVNDPVRGVAIVEGQLHVPQELIDAQNDIFRWTPGESVCAFILHYADTELATTMDPLDCSVSPRVRDDTVHHQTRPDRVQHPR